MKGKVRSGSVGAVPAAVKGTADLHGHSPRNSQRGQDGYQTKNKECCCHHLQTLSYPGYLPDTEFVVGSG